MTGRDFDALAGAIASTRRHTASVLGSAYVLRLVAEDVARVCAGTNPRFDRSRFMVACGVWGQTEAVIAEAVREHAEAELRSVTA